jgi:hypothetical protein
MRAILMTTLAAGLGLLGTGNTLAASMSGAVLAGAVEATAIAQDVRICRYHLMSTSRCRWGEFPGRCPWSSRRCR